MAESIPWESENFYYSGVVGSDNYNDADKAIIFVHGNNRDASDWSKQFKYFQEQGTPPQNLWAITFDTSSVTHHHLARQLEEFTEKVLEYTGLNEVSIIAHSLGVTVTRYWLYQFDRYDNVDVFIGIAGANHGSDVFIPKGVAWFFPKFSKYKPCQELSNNSVTPTLVEDLNRKVGETPGDVKYYTIRGSKDTLFLNCIDSPALEGAEENILLDAGHDGVRESKESLEYQYKWINSE